MFQGPRRYHIRGADAQFCVEFGQWAPWIFSQQCGKEACAFFDIH